VQGKEDKPGNYAYLDLLATALTDHEKNLNDLLERLDRVTERLSKLAQLEPKETTTEKEEEKETEKDIPRNDENLKTLLHGARGILSTENKE